MKTNQKKIAGIAGILYLIYAITGAIGIIIVPGKLIAPNYSKNTWCLFNRRRVILPFRC
jgi:hypothetical protein